MPAVIPDDAPEKRTQELSNAVVLACDPVHHMNPRRARANLKLAHVRLERLGGIKCPLP